MLNTTITLQRLAARGYASMLDHYKKVAPHLNEPLYTRPVRIRLRRKSLTPSTLVGGAGYSIMPSPFFFCRLFCCHFVSVFVERWLGGSFAKLGFSAGLCGFANVPPNALAYYSIIVLKYPNSLCITKFLSK